VRSGCSGFFAFAFGAVLALGALGALPLTLRAHCGFMSATETTEGDSRRQPNHFAVIWSSQSAQRCSASRIGSPYVALL
jgi:hypothetical protein